MSLTGADAELWREFWISFASLLRAYGAAHGMGRVEQVAVEADEDRIRIQLGPGWLEFHREGGRISLSGLSRPNEIWEFTAEGRLRRDSQEEEMDMAAEGWARELIG